MVLRRHHLQLSLSSLAALSLINAAILFPPSGTDAGDCSGSSPAAGSAAPMVLRRRYWGRDHRACSDEDEVKRIVKKMPWKRRKCEQRWKISPRIVSIRDSFLSILRPKRSSSRCHSLKEALYWAEFPANTPETVLGRVPRSCGCDDDFFPLSAYSSDSSDVGTGFESLSDDAKVIELEREMLEKFYGAGFWRSPSPLKRERDGASEEREREERVKKL